MHKNVHQGHLEFVVHQLFPVENFITNVRKEAKIKNPVTGYFMELDIWFPKLNLSFEFQDTYHYTTTWDSHIPLAEIQRKDAIKTELMRKRGETLVLVPCWWNGSAESLAAEVQFHRPDLPLPTPPLTLDGIPFNPPEDYFALGSVPGVGELMLASFPLSASFDDAISVDNSWWLGEKYDGIRFCWNYVNTKVYTRTGAELPFPFQFDRLLPQEYLDGEIWFGRGSFPDSQRLVNFTENEIDWAFLRMVTFDVPDTKASITPFEERYGILLRTIHDNHPFVVSASRALCVSKRHLQISLRHAINDGGEGVILRQPTSFYEHGRSTALFKLKASRGDKEALVVSVQTDGLVLRLPDDTLFKVPITDTLVDPLNKGDVVTFSYKSFSRRAVPVDPKVIRVREDLHWQDVLREHVQTQALNDSSNKVLHFAPKPAGYWRSEKGKNMRTIFENIAKNRNHDPLLPETWYAIAHQSVLHVKGVKAAIAQHNGSWIKTLVSLFPEIDFSESKFSFLPKNYWKDLNNRKEFFFEFAKENNFDPLVPANWYHVQRDKLRSSKGGDSLLMYYGGSLIKALQHIFPEIGFDSSQFAFLPQNYWQDTSNRRKFFESFAASRNFDPLVPKNWYSTLHESLLSFKGASSMLYHYHGNFSKALLDLFPSIGLNAKKLIALSKNLWDNPNMRRKFFVNFAKKNGFDPLVPENWYFVPPSSIIASKGAPTLLCYHGSTTKALLQLFPEIGLDKTRFAVFPVGTPWQHEKKRRAFLESYAREKGFDPLLPSNWYSVSLESFAERKHSNVVLSYHGGSLIKALMQLFPALEWDELKFSSYFQNYWQHVHNRRMFFENIANIQSFDALIPENWYLIPKEFVGSQQGGNSLLFNYGGSLSKALRHVFPEIGWDATKFSKYPQNYWKNSDHRRNFFIDIAGEMGFDPLVPHNWYSINFDTLSLKHASAVLRYYKGNLATALLDLFPEIGLDKVKLQHGKYETMR